MISKINILHMQGSKKWRKFLVKCFGLVVRFKRLLALNPYGSVLLVYQN